MRMAMKLILISLLITNVFVCHAANDYDDYEEIPEQSLQLSKAVSLTTPRPAKEFFLDDEEEEKRKKMENDVLKAQLDNMSQIFRKTVTKIKTKHKKIDMLFLVDASSSVGKENFANEISFVKRLLSDFNVSFNYTRVALITFSSRSKIVS